MRKILYLMNMHWGFIKQRPHFLAECLSGFYRVHLCFPKEYRKSNLVNNCVRGNITLQEVFRLPFIRFNLIRELNSLLYHWQIKRLMANYDIIWVTHPIFYASIKNIVKKEQMLVYDCMDDWLEFPLFLQKSFQHQVLISERELIKKSNVVFCSSSYLKKVLEKRYGVVAHKIHKINNAVSLESLKSKSNNIQQLPSYISRAMDINQVLLVYMGTISHWLDIELILASLKRFGEIAYFLFGPLYGMELPSHDRLHYMGPVEHGLVLPVLHRADALVLPFKLNKLILSVNPVKLYEYIYSCKPTIAISYEESQAFEDYVYLYEDQEGYFSLLSKLVERNLPRKRSCTEHHNFVSLNTWQDRVAEIIRIIESR